MIERGAPWGEPVTGVRPKLVAGGDPELASALRTSAANDLFVFRPADGSDFARVLGLRPGIDDAPAPTRALEVDLLAVSGLGSAVNAVVLGAPPDRLRWTDRAFAVTVEIDGRPALAAAAQGVIAASGQFVHGCDAVPRGHPGDGWAEVQVYAVPRRDRRELRRRMVTGDHLPHPGIEQRRGRRISLRMSRAVPIEIDGRSSGRVDEVVIEVTRAAGRIAV